MSGAGGPVEIRVLGPFEVRVGERVLDLGGPRLRTGLAMLVAEAGRVVGVAALADALWGEEPPAGAERTVRTYLSRLRRVLEPAGPAVELVTRAPGYLLRTEPDVLDAARFERAAAAGRAALTGGRPVEASQRLGEALGLWRGAAYGEFAGTGVLAIEGARWERRRLGVLLDRVDADLATGAGAELVAELEALVARHPEDERLWGRLLTALYRADRQADALAAFRRAREVLIERFGVEPSPALAEVHRQVLAHDPRLCRRRERRRCRRRCPPRGRPPRWPSSRPAYGTSPVGRPSSRRWTRCFRRTASPPACRSWWCPAPPASARAGSPCTGRTGSPGTSPTASST